MIYFDHNATTPLDGQVVEVMLPYLRAFYGNPSSLYRMGRIVKSAIDTAREQVAVLVNAKPAQIVFTSGGTEANNLALKTVPINTKVVISAIEHSSILEPATKNQKEGDDYSFIPVDNDGVILSSSFKAFTRLSNSAALVSVMLANNENGVIQDVKKIVHLIDNKKIIVHTDAIQAIGKIPVSFSELGVDLMSLSSHKIYGPKGCGALVVGNGVNINPILLGGGQENNFRSGTENVAAIVGFGKAAELASVELEQRTEHLVMLRKALEQQLKTISGLVIFSEQAERLPNTVQFGIEGIDGEMLLMQLDQKNIAVSSGSACSSGGGKISSVLIAMGVEHSLAKSAIRVSLGKMNTVDEVKEFVTVLKTIVIRN